MKSCNCFFQLCLILQVLDKVKILQDIDLDEVGNSEEARWCSEGSVCEKASSKCLASKQSEDPVGY